MDPSVRERESNMPRVTAAEKGAAPKATTGIYSYGSKTAVIPKTQFDFDLTKFRDPGGQKQFKDVVGTHETVKKWMIDDEDSAKQVNAIISDALLIADDLIKPKARMDGSKTEIAPISAWVSISFHDFHGKWAAPAVAELVADALDKAGYNICVTHYGLSGNR